MGPLDAAGGGLFYRFIELQNSIFILSNDMYIQSNDDICILFWLGEELQIVLTTDVVRYVHVYSEWITLFGDLPTITNNHLISRGCW